MTPPTAAELKKIALDRLDQYSSHRLESILAPLDTTLRAAAHDGLLMIRLEEVRSDCADKIRDGLNKVLRPRGFTVIVEDEGCTSKTDWSVDAVEMSAVYVDWAGDPQTT